MRITQSISLSNIQTFSFAEKAQPWGCENLPTSLERLVQLVS
jgi:hypothetical protein